MSEQTDTSTTVETFDPVDFSAVKDGSRVANEDHPAFETAIGELFETTREAATAEVSAADAIKRIADELVGIRMLITTSKQIPDLGATSDAYRLKVNATFSRAFDTVPGIDEQGIARVKANARKAVGRGPLLRATVAWIIQHENGFAQWAEQASTADGLAKLAEDPPAKLRKRVNELYDASKGLTAPYAPKKGDGFTAPPAGPTSAVTNLKRGAKATLEGKIVPADSSESLLMIVKGMAVQYLTRTVSDVENLPKVIENVDASLVILRAVGKGYHGTLTADDTEALSELVGLNDTADEDDTADDTTDEDETADVEARKLAAAEKGTTADTTTTA